LAVTTVNMDELQQKKWYWVRRDDGSTVPYVFHQVRRDEKTGQLVGDFFVGSFIRSWPLGRIVGEAQMPK